MHTELQHRKEMGTIYRSDAEATGNLLADFKRLSVRAQSLTTLSVCNVIDKWSALTLQNSKGVVGKEEEAMGKLNLYK